MGRWQRRAAEGVRFLGVGAVATVVALILFNLLLHGFGVLEDPWLSGHPIAAYVVANTVGMVVAYAGTRLWAFRDREPRDPDGGVTKFVVINVLTMLLPIACLGVSRHLLGLDDPISDNISANVIGLGLSQVARFFLFRRFVFKRPRAGQADLDQQPASAS